MSKEKTIRQKWIESIKAARTLLAEIKAMNAEDVPQAKHDEADRLLTRATQLRSEVDKEMTTAQLGWLAGQRAELDDAARFVQARGWIPVEEDGENKSVHEKIHAYAKEMHDGARASASFTIDLVAAQTQRALIRAGIGGNDLVNAARQGYVPNGLGQFVPVQAALGTGSGLVPDTWSTSFYDYQETLGGLRRAGAMVTPMDRGNQITFYRDEDHYDADTDATPEGQPAKETEDDYGSYNVTTAMRTGLVYLNRQLIEDAGPTGLMSIIDRGLSRVIARKSETAFHVPFLATGAMTYDRSTKAGANSAIGDPKIERTQILDALYGLDEGYLAASLVWLVRAMTYRHIIELKSGGNNSGYIYEPNPVAGAPDQIEGHPVLFDAFLPAIVAASGGGSDQVAAAIGDFSDAFHIVDVGGVRIDMSREFKFAEQQVTVLASHRNGAAIRDFRAARLITSDGNSS